MENPKVDTFAHLEHNLAVPTTSLDDNPIGGDDETLLKQSAELPDLANLVEKSQRASNFEHNLINRDAFKLSPKAVCFSFIMFLALKTERYDTSLLGSFLVYPTFREEYGVKSSDSGCPATSFWLSGLQNEQMLDRFWTCDRWSDC
jgi:hypothetical protein